MSNWTKPIPIHIQVVLNISFLLSLIILYTKIRFLIFQIYFPPTVRQANNFYNYPLNIFFFLLIGNKS